MNIGSFFQVGHWIGYAGRFCSIPQSGCYWAVTEVTFYDERATL